MKTTRTYLILALAGVLTAMPNTLHASAAWGLKSTVHTSIIIEGGLFAPAQPAAKAAPRRSSSARPIREKDKARS
jgi:hypothetical protein